MELLAYPPPPLITISPNTSRVSMAIATARGPQGDPGPPGSGASDADVAGYVEDTTPSDTRQAILDIIAGISPGEPTFPVDAYGAVGDGTTNDDAAFAAAKAAATAAGGGVILLGPHRYRINSAFTPGAGNSLRAPMNALATSITKYCIVLGSSTACVQLGGDSQGRGGRHGNFNVDANSTGATAGAVQVTVNDQIVSPITVKNAPGVGYLIFATQNSKILQPAVDGCQDNVVIDGGSGGLTIENLHSTSPTRYGLRLRDSNPGGHPTYGYQFGPADILFIKPLVEQYANTATALVRFDSGTRIKFEQPGLSVNGQSLSGYMVEITNDDFPTQVAAEVEFSSGNYHGGPTALEKVFYVKGTNTITYNKLVVNGQSLFQQSTGIFNTDGGTLAAIDEEQFYIAGTVSAVWGTVTGTSTLFFWRKVQRTGVIFATPDATGVWQGHAPFAIRKDTDSTAGARYWIGNDGTLAWGGGTNFTPAVTITPDPTNKFLILSGVKYAGKVVGQSSLTTVSTNVATLNTDVSTGGPTYIIVLNSSGAFATAWNLTNPTDGQEIQLWVTRAGAQTFVWPTNISWNGNTAPSVALTANQYTIVKLKYFSASSKWYEISDRCVGVPN